MYVYIIILYPDKLQTPVQRLRVSTSDLFQQRRDGEREGVEDRLASKMSGSSTTSSTTPTTATAAVTTTATQEETIPLHWNQTDERRGLGKLLKLYAYYKQPFYKQP